MKEHFLISKRCRERFLGQTAAGVQAMGLHDLAGAGISELRSPYSISRADSATPVVLFTLAGEGCLEVPAPRRVLRPGTVCVLPAGQDHVYRTKRRWHLLWFHLCTTEFWTGLMPRTAMVFKPSRASQLVVLSEEFLQEATRRDHQLLEGYARLIALLLQRELSGFKPSNEVEHRRRLERLWQEVSENPARPWSVPALALAAHLSRSHLQARVRRIYACGVMEMVARQRMERATGLLLRQLKLADVAEKVGYDSPFSFSRAFKRILGVSPENYRRRRLAG